jgi:hypothetical protein
MRLQVEGIYLKDSLLWFTLRLRNNAQVPYCAAICPAVYPGTYQSQTDSHPANRYGTRVRDIAEPNPGRSCDTFSLGYPLFTVPRDKALWLEIAERSGGRLLRLPISYKTVLKARSIN